MKSVTAQWAKDNANDIELIDVRTPAEYRMFSVQPSKNIPVSGLILNHEQFLKKEKTYYLICASGGRSSTAIDKLEEYGYNLINVNGGIGELI